MDSSDELPLNSFTQKSFSCHELKLLGDPEFIQENLEVLKEYLNKYWKNYIEIKLDTVDTQDDIDLYYYSERRRPDHLYYLINLVPFVELRRKRTIPSNISRLDKRLSFFLLLTNETIIEMLCRCVKHLAEYKVRVIPKTQLSRYDLLCEQCFKRLKEARPYKRAEKIDDDWIADYLTSKPYLMNSYRQVEGKRILITDPKFYIKLMKDRPIFAIMSNIESHFQPA